MTRRRRGRAAPPRCRSCHALVAFYRDATTGRWRVFNARPATPQDPTRSRGMPVWGGRAWDPLDLAAELEGRVDADDPMREVRDLDWYLPHQCAIAHQAAQRQEESL